MDKQISKTLYEVEKPVYQSFEDIQKQYIDKMVIITNRQGNAHEGTQGGIVRYYGKASDDFYDKWDECVEKSEYEPVLLWSFAVGVNLLGGFPV